MVVAFIGRNDYAPDFVAEDWSDHKRGLVMRTDDRELYMYEYADEDIKLVSRADQCEGR